MWVSAPGDQIAQLQQAMDSLEKARIKFGNHLQDTAEAQEKSLVDLRTTVQTQQASLHAACNDPFCCYTASYTSENSVAGSEDNKDAATEAAASLCSTEMSKCWLEVQFHAQLNLPLAVHEIGVGIGRCSEARGIHARALRRLIDKRISRRS